MTGTATSPRRLRVAPRRGSTEMTMSHRIVLAALALLLAPPALAQDPAESSGIATGAVGDTFFIQAPLEYHLLGSELPGHPVFFDTSTPVGTTAAAPMPEGGDPVDSEIREAERPLGTVTDVIVDRAGRVAGIVIELDPEMRGGDREVAVAGGLVRMVPGTDDPSQTVMLLTLDPVDLETAPDFERPHTPGEAAEQPQN
jgi:PRC-barrel domain